MYKAHIVAVHAEDRQDAINQVDSALEEYYLNVFDWYEVGGRLSDYFGDEDGEVLDVAANKDRAIECLKNLVTEMDNRFQDILEKYLMSNPDGIVRPNELTRNWPDRRRLAYALGTLSNIIGGTYSFDSNFFCLNEYNACPKFYLDRFPEDLTGLYFVAVDTHANHNMFM